MKQTNQTESLVYEVPEAGAMVGLTRNASYEAAKRGEIPTLRFGKLLRVPKAAWHKILEEGGAK
jgi:excisionase family DNA binding protein